MLNYDDPFLRKAVLPAHVRPVWFSLSDENADVCALSIRQETDVYKRQLLRSPPQPRPRRAPCARP